MIKVCGMREVENIREVEALGIDLMGFIFWPKSSRYVSGRPAYLPTQCKRVGVFVNEDIEKVKNIAEDYVLDFIQFHGSKVSRITFSSILRHSYQEAVANSSTGVCLPITLARRPSSSVAALVPMMLKV